MNSLPLLGILANLKFSVSDIPCALKTISMNNRAIFIPVVQDYKKLIEIKRLCHISCYGNRFSVDIIRYKGDEIVNFGGILV